MRGKDVTCSLRMRRCFIRKSCPSIGDDLFTISLLAFCSRHVKQPFITGKRIALEDLFIRYQKQETKLIS